MGQLIVTDGLTRTFGRIVAVDHVSFAVEAGETFGFLGPNGAGKTTTLNMLTTLLKPTAGTANVCGFDVRSQPADVRRSIGVVHQEYTADEDLTGWENIILCGKLYGLPRQDARKRADELLRLVDLHDAKDRKVQTYSGGMRRRLELACGLVNQPRLLFLDEPTLGLDVQTRVAIWSYIRALKKEYDMTILMTTHYMEEADGACDRIAIIDHGKIVKIGAPSELKASLGGDIIELKIDDNPADISDAIASLKDIKEVRKEGNLYRIKVVDGERIIPELINTTSRMGLEVARVSLLKPTLDEVYLEYTGRSLRQEQEDWENVFRHRMIMKKARA